MSRSHQRAEHILKNLQQEEEKRRLGREASIITAIPVAQEACYEPTCSPPPEQEEEGGGHGHGITNLANFYQYTVLAALTASCFWRWSHQQTKCWTWQLAACPSALPAPPVTPTGTTLSAAARCGLSAQWLVQKVWNLFKSSNTCLSEMSVFISNIIR